MDSGRGTAHLHLALLLEHLLHSRHELNLLPDLVHQHLLQLLVGPDPGIEAKSKPSSCALKVWSQRASRSCIPIINCASASGGARLPQLHLARCTARPAEAPSAGPPGLWQEATWPVLGALEVLLLAMLLGHAARAMVLVLAQGQGHGGA